MVNEIKRNISEMMKYKFNLIFANLNIFFISYFLLNTFLSNDRFVSLVMLIIWYFSTHGLANPSYIIEEEIQDMTIVSIIQSKSSLKKVLAQRSFITFIMDLLKAVPLFGILIITIDIVIEVDLLSVFVIIALTIITSYAIGFIIAGFSIKLKRVTGFVSLSYYYIFFFGGILAHVDIPVLRQISMYILPYENARLSLESLEVQIINFSSLAALIIQSLVLLVLANIIFDLFKNMAIRDGDIYGL